MNGLFNVPSLLLIGLIHSVERVKECMLIYMATRSASEVIVVLGACQEMDPCFVTTRLHSQWI